MVMAFRKPTADEQRLLKALVAVVPELGLGDEWFAELSVESMDDGGMGSLRLSSAERSQPLRMVAELQFNDTDGIPVLAALFVDEHGVPFELDLWKVNSEPLKKIPANLPAAKRFECGK